MAEVVAAQAGRHALQGGQAGMRGACVAVLIGEAPCEAPCALGVVETAHGVVGAFFMRRYGPARRTWMLFHSCSASSILVTS